MSNQAFKAFTMKFDSRTQVLFTRVKIALPFDPKKERPPEQKEINAIWDTGATNTCITRKTVEEMGLVATAFGSSQTAGGVIKCGIYRVSLMLPNNVGFAMLNVTDCDVLAGGCDILIGMDIIGKGDFAVTEKDDKTIMSFRIPHTKCIDYVDEGEKFKMQEKFSHGSATRSEVLKRRRRNKRK